jgi:transposase
MTSIANGQFFDLNASQKLQRQHPRLQRIHPGVVRRTHPEPEPEPDRSHVEGAPPPAPPSPPAPEPAEMAGKKKRTVVDENTRAVAVARVNKLVAAGNPAMQAVAGVAKELGVSESSVINWRTAARKTEGAKKGTPPKPGKKARKKRGRRIEEQIAEHVRAVEPEKLPLLPQAAMRQFVQGVVRESIRDEVRAYLNECFGISEDPTAVPLAPAKRGGK